MTKLGPGGHPTLRADGKVLKGDYYQAPDVPSVLHRQGWSREDDWTPSGRASPRRRICIWPSRGKGGSAGRTRSNRYRAFSATRHDAGLST